MSDVSGENQFNERVDIDLGDLELSPGAEPTLQPRRAVEDTRAVLAYILAGLTGLVIGGLFLLLWSERITSDDFQKLAGVMLAPLAGLLGAATAHYYGRSGGPS
jgi:hypothetical protein